MLLTSRTDFCLARYPEIKHLGRFEKQAIRSRIDTNFVIGPRPFVSKVCDWFEGQRLSGARMMVREVGKELAFIVLERVA